MEGKVRIGKERMEKERKGKDGKGRKREGKELSSHNCAFSVRINAQLHWPQLRKTKCLVVAHTMGRDPKLDREVIFHGSRHHSSKCSKMYIFHKVCTKTIVDQTPRSIFPRLHECVHSICCLSRWYKSISN